MAAGDIVPVSGAQFEETLASASPDVLREWIRQFAQRMMDADVEVACNAGYGEITPDRVNSRNGYRRREWDTGPGRLSWPSRSCGTGRTSRRSWSIAAARSGHWPPGCSFRAVCRGDSQLLSAGTTLVPDDGYRLPLSQRGAGGECFIEMACA